MIKHFRYRKLNAFIIVILFIFMSVVTSADALMEKDVIPIDFVINGSNFGKVAVLYDYKFNLIDPEKCDLFFNVDGDDGNIKEWIRPHDPYQEVVLTHTWDNPTIYNIFASPTDYNYYHYNAALEVNIMYNKTLYVGGSGPGNYTTIQNAINDAYPGDTVFVYDDSSPYYENIYVIKSINLIGENKNTTIIDGEGEDMVLIMANNVSFSGFTIQNGRYGFRIISSLDSTIFDNRIINNSLDGIFMTNSSYNVISNNIFHYNYNGIGLHQSGSEPGPCYYNNIQLNTISLNYNRGITMSLFHEYNNIIGNTIANNLNYGIKICCSCNNNKIYHNNLQSNGQNGEDQYSNYWDNGYPSGGNYWDDYNGTDENGDGIGDTPYNISGGDNQDRYPLMNPCEENQPPTPPAITGPKSGKAGKEYEYTFVSTDPNVDDIYYLVQWGDASGSQDWVGPFPSNQAVILNHTYTQNGIYTIFAKAFDIYDAESEWSSYEVTMPRNKVAHGFTFIRFFKSLLNTFPILQYIFG